MLRARWQRSQTGPASLPQAAERLRCGSLILYEAANKTAGISVTRAAVPRS